MFSLGAASAVARWIKSGFRLIEFHRFPFDISKPLGPEALGVLALGCNILQDLGENYRVTDGTALGLFRDGRFIPHDNDIDVDVLDCIRPVKLLYKFIANGFSLGRLVISDGKVHQAVFFDVNDTLFDIVFWYSRESCIVSFSEPGYLRKQSAEYFLEKTRLKFCDIEVVLPGNMNSWLNYRYGTDWAIPKTYKGDWKAECGDISLQ